MPTPYAYFQKQFVPLAEAKIGVMTHAFNYGTGCFEGIRGNWNEQDERVYLFRLRDHFLRLGRSCRILKIDLPYSRGRALRHRHEARRDVRLHARTSTCGPSPTRARRSSACACTTWRTTC